MDLKLLHPFPSLSTVRPAIFVALRLQLSLCPTQPGRSAKPVFVRKCLGHAKVHKSDEVMPNTKYQVSNSSSDDDNDGDHYDNHHDNHYDNHDHDNDTEEEENTAENSCASMEGYWKHSQVTCKLLQAFWSPNCGPWPCTCLQLI